MKNESRIISPSNTPICTNTGTRVTCIRGSHNLDIHVIKARTESTESRILCTIILIVVNGSTPLTIGLLINLFLIDVILADHAYQKT